MKNKGLICYDCDGLDTNCLTYRHSEATGGCDIYRRLVMFPISGKKLGKLENKMKILINNSETKKHQQKESFNIWYER